MYVPAQTNNADWRAVWDCRFVTSYGQDFGRVTIMKHTLLREINQDMALHHLRRNPHALDAVHDPWHVSGAAIGLCRDAGVPGTFTTGVPDSIAEFMADTQERQDIVE